MSSIEIIEKKKQPTLIECNSVVRDMFCCISNKCQSILNSMQNTDKSSDHNKTNLIEGMYKFASRQSGTTDWKHFSGEAVQEMLDPGRTRGCYFTVDKSIHVASED